MSLTNDRSRELLALTFRNACRASTAAGLASGAGLPLNAAGVAGLLLHAMGSAADALQAVRHMPPGDVWSDVIAYLEPLAAAERADTERPKATG